ncbi:unnamed protein product [Rhizoctonia solani]|uniref:Uncharacterized protein n=1 Tax=Rhizoctonia solani TaxID=456999 RepID=A0A8H3E7E2_9AGAM|nr:unnamed protein product [Rhizoctonia solani]
MSRNMDTLFVRAGRPVRLHFDDSRIPAAAIRQLSWRVEQGGGAIVDQPSSADVLVVDPAAPWVFRDFLKTKRPELRPSVVLAFWIPLCLTTQSLIWVNHPYWQQVVVPSERPPHPEVPQGIMAYSSFLAGISYSKNILLSSTKNVPRSSTALDRDSSVISNLDNSDLEVSRSLEPDASSDDEPLEIPRKPKQSISHKMTPKSDPRSAAASPQHEVRMDEAEVSDILPTGEVSLPLDDIDMSSPSLLPEPIQQPQEESHIDNVVPPSLPTLSRLAEKQPPDVLGLSGASRHGSPSHASPRNEQDPSPSRNDPPASATVAVEPTISSTSQAARDITEETGPPIAPQHTGTKSTSPVASEPVVVTKGEGAYVPPTLDATPPPAPEELNSTLLDSSPKIPNIVTHEPSVDTTSILDKHRAPSGSNTPSTTRSEPTISEVSNASNGPQETQSRAPPPVKSTHRFRELAGSTVASAETALTSTPPPNTPTTAPKPSILVSSKGPDKLFDLSSSTHRSKPKPSPSNATKIKVRPKMRPVPQPDDNESVASSSTPQTSLPQPKSKLKIQSGANGAGTKPRPSTIGGTPIIKHSQKTALANSPASTVSSSVTNHTTSLPASANTTPATTVATETPNPALGPSLSRPKKMIIRSPTSPTTTRGGPSTSVSPVQTRHLARDLDSSSPEVVPMFSPPTPPVPTPEQLDLLAAKRPAWTQEEDQYIIDYMNWVFAQDPLASTSEIMREIAANCPYRGVSNWQNRFTSKEDSIYMNEVPVLFERLTNKTSGGSSSQRNVSGTQVLLGGSRTRNRRAIDYVDSSDDENGADAGDGPPRKKARRSRASGRRHR